ncbi:MAG: MarR family transcriptional regulator [Micromonosporaceae bacterium]
MSSVASSDRGRELGGETSRDNAGTRSRRRLAASIKDSLRGLSIQLSLLNHQVGSRVALKQLDLDCLDLLLREGPLSPSALARRSGLHPATMTGILDRMERGGWVSRERDPSDRRAVVVQASKDRVSELFGLYAGMNHRMDDLFTGYSDADLQVLADFLSRTSDAGREATSELSSGPNSPR